MNGRFPYHSPLFFHLFNASFHHRGHGGHRGECVLLLTVVTLILMRNPPTIKLKKHENICHLQPNACNALVDK